MTKILPRLLCICLCCFFAGCATQTPSGQIAAAPADSVAAPPAVPPGMRLGAPYISALNEPCYGLVSVGNPFEPAHALCLRDGTWKAAPSVLTVLPGNMPAGR